jgi:hypothetical protein
MWRQPFVKFAALRQQAGGTSETVHHDPPTNSYHSAESGHVPASGVRVPAQTLQVDPLCDALPHLSRDLHMPAGEPGQRLSSSYSPPSRTTVSPCLE